MTDDECHMAIFRSLGQAVLVAALLAASGAQAFDDANYPDLTGQWERNRDGVWPCRRRAQARLLEASCPASRQLRGAG
jgi:hypothetical protein